MQNMGTWNSDMAMIYLALFLFPLVMLILREIVAIWPQPKTITKVKYVQLPAQTVYKTKTETKIVYKKTQGKNASNFRKRKPRKPKEKGIEFTKIKTKPSYLAPVQKDAMGALVSIGMKKTDAKSLVTSKFDPAKHATFESLFRDCMSQS